VSRKFNVSKKICLKRGEKHTSECDEPDFLTAEAQRTQRRKLSGLRVSAVNSSLSLGFGSFAGTAL
jgi:hypothetical protein